MTSLQRECLEFHKIPFHYRPKNGIPGGLRWSDRQRKWAMEMGFIDVNRVKGWYQITQAGRSALEDA